MNIDVTGVVLIGTLSLVAATCGQPARSGADGPRDNTITNESSTPVDAQGQMSVEDMMKDIRQNCQAPMQSMDALQRTIVEARASNDSTRMRSALLQTEESLDEMHRRMDICVNTMGMMEQLHVAGAER